MNTQEMPLCCVGDFDKIVIYSNSDYDVLPREIIRTPFEDCAEWPFYINLMRWLGLEVAGLFISPAQVVTLVILILYPTALSC